MKVKYTLTRTDIYNYYRRNAKSKNINRFLFFDILKEYSRLCFEKMVYEGYKIVFPEKIGNVKVAVKEQELINKKGRIALAIDWGKTKELWKTNEEARKKKVLIRHLNKHTDGNLYLFFYTNLKLPLEYRRLLRFRVNKRLRHEFSKMIKNKELKVNFNSYYLMTKKEVKDDDV